MNKTDLKRLIEKIVREEFLEEMSTTGGSAAASGNIQTPHAFSGKDEKKTVGWRGAEFGEESMPNPDERKSNAVDDDYPAKLSEMIVKQPPSSAAHLAFPISKEIKEFESAIENYKKAEAEKFINDLKGKLQGKSAKFVAQKGQPHEKVPFKVYSANILDVKPHLQNGKFYVVLLTDKAKYFLASEPNKKMLVYGEEEAPVTRRTQNTPQQNPESQNLVKI